jgi:hypothetical protein
MAEWSEQLWPSIKRGRKPELAFIHPFVADTCSSEHRRRHIKRPAATLDRPATLPGVDRALYSLTGRSTSRGSAALSIQSDSSHHSNRLTTATSRYPSTSTAGSIHHERRACRRAHQHKPLHGDSLLIKTYNYGMLTNTVQSTLNKYYTCWYRDYHFTTSHGTHT